MSKLYEDYLFWRRLGFRAVTAYAMAKHGFFQVLGAMEDWD